MPRYGNPDRPNKYEISARQMIEKIERSIVEWLAQAGDPPGRSIRIDPELYYDDDGQPCCFLEMYLAPSSSFRVGAQRNNLKKHRPPWTIGWNVYSHGKAIDEGEFDAAGISQIAPELTNSILGKYAYLIR